jgi:hypothetical protein
MGTRMSFDAASSTELTTRRPLIAAPWHTLSILLIFGYFGFRQGTPQHALVPESAAAAVSHAAIIRGYLISVAYEFGMAYWVWAGVHWKGGTLRDLTGGRWYSWRSIAVDVGIAIPFFLVWEFTAWAVHLAVDRISTPRPPTTCPLAWRKFLYGFCFPSRPASAKKSSFVVTCRNNSTPPPAASSRPSSCKARSSVSPIVIKAGSRSSSSQRSEFSTAHSPRVVATFAPI